ncbi:hypothetical protein CTI14_26100, partial [Methylobacterium radiotolerans]
MRSVTLAPARHSGTLRKVPPHVLTGRHPHRHPEQQRGQHPALHLLAVDLLADQAHQVRGALR